MSLTQQCNYSDIKYLLESLLCAKMCTRKEGDKYEYDLNSLQKLKRNLELWSTLHESYIYLLQLFCFSLFLLLLIISDVFSFMLIKENLLAAKRHENPGDKYTSPQRFLKSRNWGHFLDGACLFIVPHKCQSLEP